MKTISTYESNRVITISAARCLSAPYQRETDNARINTIVKHFDKNKVRPIILSYRNGRYYVIDGQHTLSVLRMLYGEDVMVTAVVVEGLTYKQEAEYYTKQYENSKKLTVRDTFKSRLEYDNKAQAIKNVCENAGFTVSISSNKAQGKGIIVAVKHLEKMYDELGRGDTYNTLCLIRDTWNGDKHSVEGNMLSGMTLFYKKYKDILDKNAFISRLGAVSPKEIMRNAKMRVMSSRQAMYAYEIYYIYNKGIKRNKLPDVIR